MADLVTLHTDNWGAIHYSKNAERIEIVWQEASAAMSGEDFITWLSHFADFTESKKPRFALVDARNFRMPPGSVDIAWRDQEITPRYNAVGLEKFAFVMPPGMPAIDAPAQKEGPANYPTAYFGDRDAALTWLESSS